MARRCDHCGEAFAEGSVHVCPPVDFKENLKKAMKHVEGVKHDQGKPDFSLLPPDALEEVVRVYDFGVKKYERDNWRKGIKYSRIFGAIMRHLWAWWKGTDRDEESGLRHLAQAAWGCFTLLEYTRTAKYGLFDDRLVETSVPVDNSGDEFYELKPVKPEPPPRGVLCFHEWEYDTSYSDTAGLHTRWRCKKCHEIRIVNDPPISIPSVWVGSPWPITFSLTTTEHPEGVTYTYMNGEVVKALSKQPMPPPPKGPDNIPC